MEQAVRTVACPNCKEPALYFVGNPWRPFCSERCRNADLGDWANERFRVAAEPAASDTPDGSVH